MTENLQFKTQISWSSLPLKLTFDWLKNMREHVSDVKYHRSYIFKALKSVVGDCSDHFVRSSFVERRTTESIWTLDCARKT